MHELLESLTSSSAILQIALINIVLSGDNAVVIAMAARNLPERQRKQAVLWGCLLATALQVILTMLVSYVMLIPGVKIVGGMALAWIACKLLQSEGSEEHGADSASTSLRTAIGQIAVADLIMSLDNVVAIAGLSGSNTTQLIVGLTLSIASLLFFSQTIMVIMDRFRWIAYGGTAILAATAAQLIWHELASGESPLLGNATLTAWAGWLMQGVFVVACLTSPRWWPQRRELEVDNVAQPQLAGAFQAMSADGLEM